MSVVPQPVAEVEPDLFELDWDEPRRTRWWEPGAVFVVVRLVGVLILAGIGAARGKSLVDSLNSWDGQWYLRIAATGYSALSAGVDANGHTAID
ncbi:MAG TPA: hypothetical protein VHZ97_17590, partial [Pseudonocardiaceae bacterium]|nr:hypothetical protein [Pseudonocardiaceae bacterium]